LTDTTATLRAGGTEQTVTLDALAARWQGDWGTLWRAPPGYDAAVPLRESPELGRWVREHLPAADAQTPLRARLRSFQLAQGLNADGALGPLTYMQLNRRAGVDEPRLRTGP
jgi:general secretion pathway protein A